VAPPPILEALDRRHRSPSHDVSRRRQVLLGNFPEELGKSTVLVPDRQNNTVHISDRLELDYPAMAANLRRVLRKHNVPLRVIRGTKTVWCRDFMPIQVAPGEFVRFRPDPETIGASEDTVILPKVVKRCVDSEIVLDGGNVVG